MKKSILLYCFGYPVKYHAEQYNLGCQVDVYDYRYVKKVHYIPDGTAKIRYGQEYPRQGCGRVSSISLLKVKKTSGIKEECKYFCHGHDKIHYVTDPEPEIPI